MPTKKGDVAFFKRTLADDFAFVSFDGRLYGRQDMVDQYVQAGTDILPYEMRVASAGDESQLLRITLSTECHRPGIKGRRRDIGILRLCG